MAALDVLVVPSCEDAQSLVIPQAFATGKPVVASRVGGIPEILEHEKTGLLVSVGDDAGFAEAMVRLAESPGFRARLGAEALCFARRELSFDRKAEVLLQSYNWAINRMRGK